MSLPAQANFWGYMNPFSVYTKPCKYTCSLSTQTQGGSYNRNPLNPQPRLQKPSTLRSTWLFERSLCPAGGRSVEDDFGLWYRSLAKAIAKVQLCVAQNRFGGMALEWEKTSGRLLQLRGVFCANGAQMTSDALGGKHARKFARSMGHCPSAATNSGSRLPVAYRTCMESRRGGGWSMYGHARRIGAP